MESKDFKNSGLLTYTLNGVEGCLIDMENEKVAGINPVAQCCGTGFYPIDSIKGLNLTEEDVTCEYYSAYGGDGFSPKGCEIVDDYVRNVEDEQHLIPVFADKELADDDEYERMLIVMTDKYYDWTSILSRTIDNVWDCDTEKLARERYEEDWVAAVEQYKGKCAAWNEEVPMTFDEILDYVKERGKVFEDD